MNGNKMKKNIHNNQLNLVEKLKKEIDVFDLELVNNYISKMEISNNSKRMYVFQLKKYYQLLNVDCSKLNEYKQTKNISLRGLTFDEVEKINDITIKSNIFYHLVFRIFLETGIRLNEFLQVNWCELMSTTIEIKTLKQKSDEFRLVFITDETLSKLKLFNGSTQCKNWQYLNENKIHYIFNKIEKLVGLDISLSPHVLRRTKGTLLRMNGAGIEDIADILGHSSMDCTRIYYSKLNHSYLKSISNMSELKPAESLDLISLKHENESLRKQIYFLKNEIEKYKQQQ